MGPTLVQPDVHPRLVLWVTGTTEPLGMGGTSPGQQGLAKTENPERRRKHTPQWLVGKRAVWRPVTQMQPPRGRVGTTGPPEGWLHQARKRREELCVLETRRDKPCPPGLGPRAATAPGAGRATPARGGNYRRVGVDAAPCPGGCIKEWSQTAGELRD